LWKKIDSILRGINYGPLNMAGVYLRTSKISRPKSDVLKQVFQIEKNILWKFQMDGWHFECFILMIVKGKLFLFRGELAMAP
jgi:hypothetical protein